MIKVATGFTSVPMECIPCTFASTKVVPQPANKSAITPSVVAYFSINFLTTLGKNLAGYR